MPNTLVYYPGHNLRTYSNEIFTTYTLEAQYISPTHIKYVTTYVCIPQDHYVIIQNIFSRHIVTTYNLMCQDITRTHSKYVTAYMYVSGH